MQDVREAFRTLRATPLVTTIAVLSLTLGIGANTAIFSILNSLLLRPLPVRDPHGLVAVGSPTPGQDAELTYPVWLALRDRTLLDGTFAWARDGLSDVQAGETRPVGVIWASGRFFDTLGVTAIAGRTLDARDDRRGGGPDGAAAVLSAAFWQRRFGGAADILGKTIVLDRVPFTIVGVADPSFFGLEVGSRFDVVLPLEAEPLLQRSPSRLKQWPWLHVLGRLPPGQTPASAAAALVAAQPSIRAATMPDYASARDRDDYLTETWTLRSAANGTSRLRGRYGSALTTLMAIAGLVLLVGCANIANLQLARAGARRYERSIRSALGASRWRLMRPVLAESLLLAAAGTALGLALARPAGALLVAQLATWVSAPDLDLAPDARVLAVSAALLSATALLFGVAPAILAGRAAPIEALKRGPAGGGRRGPAVREILVGLQIAVCVLLLVGAGLFIRSFAALAYRDLGFDRRPVVVAAIDATRSAVPPEQRLALFERMRERAAALSAAGSAALSMATPLGNAGVRFTPLVSLNAADIASDTAPRILTNVVSPDWFATYGTRMKAGRDFSRSDTAGSAPVAVVNDAFARRFFPGTSPLGRTFSTTTPGLSFDQAVAPEIVGVVEDAAFTSVRNAIEPTVYRPLAQVASADLLKAVPTLCLSVRAGAGASPAGLRGMLAPELTAVDAGVSVATVTVDAQLDAYHVRERLLGLLAGFFAALGLLLAAIGLYGVTSHWVSGRRRELGIRIALGAEGHRVAGLVLRRLALVTICGAVAGGAASLAAGRLVESLLFGVQARDPLSFAAAAVTLFVTCIAAAWLPARRAARTDPMIVLRES